MFFQGVAVLMSQSSRALFVFYIIFSQEVYRCLMPRNTAYCRGSRLFCCSSPSLRRSAAVGKAPCYSSIGEERCSAGSRGTTETKTNHNSNNPGYEEKQTTDTTDDNNIPRQVIDADSCVVPIPENVTTVAAVGDIALYVEALGDRGRLVVSSESFTTSGRLVRAVFGEEELANIATLWTMDGSTQMEDDSFRRLVALKPDVCFVISGRTPFSDEQLRTLEDRLVPVVPLPPLNNSENIFKTVELIGIVLGDRSDYGQRNTIEVAAQYMEWYGDIIRQARSYGRAFGGPDKLNLDHNRYEDFEDIIDDYLFASGTPYSL